MIAFTYRTRMIELQASESLTFRGPGGAITLNDYGVTIEAIQIDIKGPVKHEPDGASNALSIDLYIAGNLDRSDKLTMQYPSGGGGTLCCRELSAVAALPKQPAERVMDVETGASMLRFEAPPVKSHEPLIGVVAINAAEMTQAIDGDDVTVRAESGLLRITSCFSQEGSHLFVRQDGRLVSHFYYGLDYDVQPTCPEALFEEEVKQ